MDSNYMKNLFLLLTAVLCSLTAPAQKVKTGGVTYLIKDGHAIIYEADKNASEITIEGFVVYKGQQYKVTAIRNISLKKGKALSRAVCPKLRHVTFSRTCTEIMSFSLLDSNVETITIPNTISRILAGAFRDSRLSRVEIPNSVVYIGKVAFAGCSYLQQILISNSVKEIGAGAFSSCENLKMVKLPASLESIEDDMFGGCSTLKEIVIPSSVRSIEKGAFWDCKQLFDIVLPDGVNVDKYAFGYQYHGGWTGYDYYCNNLSNVKYHSGKTASDLLDFLPPECPFVKSGGKLRNPDFDKPLLAKYYAAQGASTVPVVQEPEAAVPDVAMESVDRDIPAAKKAQPKTFVLVIANEQYSKESIVPYAVNDGKMFEQYCHQTLGIPQKNIHKVENATLNNMKYEIDWLCKVLMAYKGEARAIVYYAGHGIPDEASKTAYLLPVDGYGSNVSTGYSLKELYKVLSEQPSQSVTVFLDACFSGANRESKMMASARGVAIKVKEQKPDGKLIVFSAAQGDETAYPFKEQQHGMFTYYLLKKLKETKGDVTLGDLSDYVTTEVQRQSIVVNGKMQTPKIISSISMADSWKNMKLK